MERSSEKNLGITLNMTLKSSNLEFILEILKSKEGKIVVSINYGEALRILKVNRNLNR